MRKNKGQHLDYFQESLNRNMSSYQYYVERLCELAVSMFKWENLPETVNERFIETQLFYNGMCVYFNDDAIGDLCLACAGHAPYDVYGTPTKRRGYSPYNGYSIELDESNSVVIWNNYLRTNTYPKIKHFAMRLYDYDRIADVNTNTQKTPLVIQCSQQQRLSLLNLFKEYDGNAPVIFGDKNLDLASIKVIDTQSTYIAGDILNVKEKIWSEALEYLGIQSSSSSKTERLTQTESSSLTSVAIASRYSRLEARRMAANSINKMFGTDIVVNYREDFIQTVDELTESISEDSTMQGAENEQVHDGS